MSFAPDDDLTAEFTCPECGDTGDRQHFASRDYSCPGCNLTVAHVELAPNGAVRGVFGWLLSPGTLLAGRYLVNSLLGRGGFAATYGVADTKLANRRCALKEVPAILFDSGEMEILSRLDHPGIPNIRDKFELGPMVYLVLEFGGQRSLGMERIERGGTIPVDVLLPWISQLCGVLDYLHAQNPPIVHRDLKPGNVLLTEDGRINLIDFGIAKESIETTQTRTIARSATHGFSPPEQVLGTGTDQRSDVYALGATLFQLLTGKRPPPAHERVAGAKLVRPSSLVAGISRELDELILRSMELNIHSRIQSIREFASRLDAIAAGRPIPLAPKARVSDDAPTYGAERGLPPSLNDGDTLALGSSRSAVAPSAAHSRRSIPALAALLLIGLAGVGGAVWWLQREPALPPAASIDQPASGSSSDDVLAATSPASQAAEAANVSPNAANEPPSGSQVEPDAVATKSTPPSSTTASSNPTPAADTTTPSEAGGATETVSVPPPIEPVAAHESPESKPAPTSAATAPPPRRSTPKPPTAREPVVAEREPATPPTGANTEPEPPPQQPDWGAGFKKGTVRRID